MSEIINDGEVMAWFVGIARTMPYLAQCPPHPSDPDYADEVQTCREFWYVVDGLTGDGSASPPSDMADRARRIYLSCRADPPSPRLVEDGPDIPSPTHPGEPGPLIGRPDNPN